MYKLVSVKSIFIFMYTASFIKSMKGTLRSPTHSFTEQYFSVISDLLQ